MRDTQAFQIKLPIKHEIFSKIDFEKFVILRFKNIERQRISAFLNGMSDFFKLSKHGLPEERAAQVVDLPVNDISPHLRIARCLEQMMREQFFIKCRGYLGQKNRILVILKQLCVLREPAVHGVTSLVRECVNIGENVLL